MNSSSNCILCNTKTAIYVCPRCSAPYCSVDCYKLPIHSKCSESFYKECIEAEMKVSDNDPEAKKRMIEILKRNQDVRLSDESDSDDEVCLEERLKGINLDDVDEVWDKLTLEEQQEFLEFAKSGDVSQIVPMWIPWWNEKHPRKKVTFVDEPENNFKLSCPEIVRNILPLGQISKISPSPLVFNNLINVLSAYAMTCRFFNGEHSLNPDEASSILMKISRNLSSGNIYETLEHAVACVSNESVDNVYLGASQENIAHMKCDIVKIAIGPNEEEPSFYVLSALSDIISLFNFMKSKNKAFTMQQPKHTSLPSDFNKRIPNEFSKKEYNAAIKKLEYYLSWVNSHYNDVYKNFQQLFPDS